MHSTNSIRKYTGSVIDYDAVEDDVIYKTNYQGFTGTMKKQITLDRVFFVRHGSGKQKWPDGTVYDGEWDSGKVNGFGTFYHANGDKYTGYFVNNKADG